MQSLFLFGQIVPLINHAPSFVQEPESSHTLVRIHMFLLGFFNLHFFHLDEFSFCLWKGATVLDNLAFQYVTTLFNICLLGGFILLVNSNSLHKATARIKVCIQAKKMAERMKLQVSKNALCHGISTFLMLSYTHYTVTSFQILSRLTLTGEGGVTVGNFVLLQGNVEYFGEKHLPYAIPAMLVLLFLSIPPPLILISYPLLRRIRTKLRRREGCDDDTTF